MLDVEVLLTETELIKQFLEALEQRFLPEKFFYWFPLSVQAWLDLCRDTQPYRNYSRSYRMVAEHAGEIAHALPGERREVVGLGAGQGDKDLLVLEALRAAGIPARYRPVDSSQALLEIALERAVGAGFHARGLKADLENPESLDRLAASAHEPRLYLLLGNTLGALDPPIWLSEFSARMRPEDYLVADGEIFAEQETVQGYDNPVNRRFAFAPLASLGLEEGKDGALRFETRSDERVPGRHFIGKHFRAARRLRLSMGGHPVELNTGEIVAMSASWKYSRLELRRTVQEAGGFDLRREFVSEDERFVMLLGAPAER